MNVYVVEGNCGDYYCEGVHVIGIYTSERLAELAREAASKAVHIYMNHEEPRKQFKTWYEVEVRTYTVDEAPVVRCEVRG